MAIVAREHKAAWSTSLNTKPAFSRNLFFSRLEATTAGERAASWETRHNLSVGYKRA